MKVITILMLVLCVVSVGNAYVIEVVIDGPALCGPVLAGDEIPIKIVLNDNDSYPAYPAYDGYWLASMDLNLTVTNATLHNAGTAAFQKMKHSADFGTWSQNDLIDGATTISKMSGTTSVVGLGGNGTPSLVWNFFVKAGGTGDIILDLSNNFAGEYKVNKADSAWITLTNADLGDLVFATVPIFDPLPPLCWRNCSHCNGDSDGNKVVDINDWPAFRDGFGSTYPDAIYMANVCADYDKNGTIDIADWPAFRDNFGSTPVADCPSWGTWPPL